MIDPAQFRDHVITPTIRRIGLYSIEAQRLLLGTVLVESNLTWIKQIGGGPGLGVYQIEPATHRDVWENYLSFRAPLSAKISAYISREIKPTEQQLVWNLAYATAIARVIYYRVRDPLPHKEDAARMAEYHKRWYNTVHGKTDPAESIVHFQRAIELR